MNYLELNLSGPMQYYAVPRISYLSNMCDVYATSPCPTRSAIAGLLGNAMGCERDDPLVREWAAGLDMLYKDVSHRKGMLLKDYQTSKRTELEKMLGLRIIRMSGSGNPNDDNAALKSVYYLEDAKFKVFVGAEDVLLRSFYNALRNPARPLYLGKRNCVPNEPIMKQEQFGVISENVLKEDKDVFECP